MANMTTLQILQGVHDWVLDKIDEETANFITKTVNDLVNYYTKSETYTKAEVQQIVDAIKQFTYEVVQVLPTASASTMNKIYLVPAPKSEDKNVKEEYITIQDGSTYSWEMLGTTSIDLSNYYTKGQTDSAISSALSSALASYTTTADLTTLLAQKQDVIQDLATIRSGASAGSTAVQPSEMESAIKETEEDVEENYAKKDGAYETLLAGSALNLQGQQVSQNNSMYRTTAGSEDVASGIAELVSVKGNTVAWNQLVPDGNFEDESSFTVRNYTSFSVLNNVGFIWRMSTAGSVGSTVAVNDAKGDPTHKYYMAVDALSMQGYDVCLGFMQNSSNPTTSGNPFVKTNSSSFQRIRQIASPNNSAHILSIRLGVAHIPVNTTARVKNLVMCDLTLIYGAGNEPTNPEQFEADYFKWFGKPLTYDSYDAGSLRPAMIDGLKSTGFNQYNPESGLLKAMIGEQYQITGTYSKVWESEKESMTFSEYTYGNEFEHNLGYSVNGARYISRNNASAYEEKVYPLGYCCIYENQVYKCNTAINTAEEWDATKWDLIADVAAMVTEGIFVPMDITPDSNGIFTPTKFYVHVEGGNNTDTCVHLTWSGTRNGEYEPYKEHVVPFDVTQLSGKLNGEGNSVVVFPDGMKRVNDVYDEIVIRDGKTWAIKRVQSVDLGSRTWTWYQENKHSMLSNTLTSIKTGGTIYVPNLLAIGYEAVSTNTINNSTYTIPCVSCSSFSSGKRIIIRNVAYSDLATFAGSLQGVYLYYELAEPREYVLDDVVLPINLTVDDWGTEEVVGANGSCAPTLGIIYGINAVDQLRRMPQSYISEASMDNFLSRLGSVMGGTWSKTWNAESEQYDFSFTQSVQSTTNEEGE